MQTQLVQVVTEGDGGEAGSEAPSASTTSKYTIYRVNQYPVDFDYSRKFSKKSNWYCLVFKPYNDKYKTNYRFYADKGIDYARRMMPTGKYLITRETEAEKIHINVMICTEKDMTYLDERATKWYKVYAKPVISREQCYQYITKEAHIRHFLLYKDYYIYDAPCKNQVKETQKDDEK